VSRFAIYEIDTGKIERIYDGDDGLLPLNLQKGEAALRVLPHVTEANAAVVTGRVVEKQPLPIPEFLQVIADGVDECVIAGIPPGVVVQWPDGQTDEVTDGEVRFSVDLPGTYTLVFEAVEYLRKEITIEAVPATES